MNEHLLLHLRRVFTMIPQSLRNVFPLLPLHDVDISFLLISHSQSFFLSFQYRSNISFIAKGLSSYIMLLNKAFQSQQIYPFKYNEPLYRSHYCMYRRWCHRKEVLSDKSMCVKKWAQRNPPEFSSTSWLPVFPD